jgi:U4/U6 small nuclear ribonucleoprotein PRP4
VYAICFQPDGSLALSGGLDGHGRVWDLRTGRAVMALKGHVRSVLCCDWAADGRTMATGSADACCRLWDARKAGTCLATLPAHAALLTAVRFEPGGGGVLLTASHDGTFKLWQAPRWNLLRAMLAGEGRLMAADVAQGVGLVATASYDRTVKIFTAASDAQGQADVEMRDGGDEMR